MLNHEGVIQSTDELFLIDEKHNKIRKRNMQQDKISVDDGLNTKLGDYFG
ncbi:MAG: hypothetical protein R6U15_03735 [Candidatus Izemoplasmatales bacterium]